MKIVVLNPEVYRNTLKRLKHTVRFIVSAPFLSFGQFKRMEMFIPQFVYKTKLTFVSMISDYNNRANTIKLPLLKGCT